jgi:AraC-like DNA-binding protein
MATRGSIPDKPQVATIAVRNFRALDDVLRSLGADPAQILENVGLEPNLFVNLERTILYSDLELLSEAMRATGCRDLGLHVGILQGIDAAGLVGLVSMNSPTVRDALGVIVAGLKTTDGGGAVMLAVRDDVATLGYSVIAGGVKNAEQFCDASVAILLNAMRQFCGMRWCPDRVYLMNEPPEDLDQFAQFFGAPIEYRAPVARMTFDSAVLDRPVEVHDPSYREILAPILEKAIEAATGDFVVAAKSILHSNFGDGRLSRSDASRALGVSVDVLTRRLKSAGVTFTDLAEQLKIERAQGLLLKEKRIREISSDLGFADVSSFSRAFKKWVGQSPGRWREARIAGRALEAVKVENADSGE